jgi:outer membrane lipoprotein SlyB
MSPSDTPSGTPILRAEFASAADMQQAIDTLEVNGFDHADVTLLEAASRDDPVPHDSDTSPAFGEADARQSRTLHASGVAAAAGLAAAGITVATGGLAAAAVGAAVVAGAAAGGLIHAVSTAVNEAEQLERDARAADGRLILSVQVPTPEKKARAEAILWQAGARDIATV